MQTSVKEDRQKYIGGSDIPSIMGISPFKSRFDLLLEKAELKEPDFEGNVYTEYGNTMEGKIRDYVNKMLARNFVEGCHVDEEKGIRCHTDGEDETAILEIKTTSQIHDDISGYKVYLVQLLFYMDQTNKADGVLAVYRRPEDLDEDFTNHNLSIFTIHKSDYEELVNQINTAVAVFKQDLERLKENPLLTEEELVPAVLREVADKVIFLEQQLATFKTLEKQYNDARAQLKEAMEKYGTKGWTTPNGTQITLVPDTEDREVEETFFDEKHFAEEHKAMYEKYTITQLVNKKGRKGYVRITMPKE